MDYIDIPKYAGIRKTERGHEIIGERIRHETGAKAREADFPHPIVVLMVYNKTGDYLLQMRSKNVTKPHTLDFSSAGHLDYGETLEDAMEREADEELSKFEVRLKKNDMNLLNDQPTLLSKKNPKHINFVFEAEYNGDIIEKGSYKSDEEECRKEVDFVKFYSIEELMQLRKDGKIKDSIIEYFTRFKNIDLDA